MLSHTHISNILAWVAFISKCWCVKYHTSFLGLCVIFSLSCEVPRHNQFWPPFSLLMPSSRSFYACKTRSISTKVPRIRPFAFYGKTNRSSWGHIQNDCEKCDGGKFWPLASSCSHVFVPVDENHTDCRADILMDWLHVHRGDVQLQAEQILHTASHQHSPGWGKETSVSVSCSDNFATTSRTPTESPWHSYSVFLYPFYHRFPKIEEISDFYCIGKTCWCSVNLVGYN